MVCLQPLQFVSQALTGSVNKVFSQSVMTSQVPITTSAPAIVSQPASGVVTSQQSAASSLPSSTMTTVPVTVSAQMLCRPGTQGTIQVPRAMMPIKQTATIRQTRPMSPVIRTPTPVRVTTPINKTTTIASKGPPKLTAAQIRMQAKALAGPVVTLGAGSALAAATVSSDLVNSGSVSTVLTSVSSAATVVQSDSRGASVVTPIIAPAVTSVINTASSALSTGASTLATATVPTPQLIKAPVKEKEKKLSGAAAASVAAAAAARCEAAASASSNSALYT